MPETETQTHTPTHTHTDTHTHTLTHTLALSPTHPRHPPPAKPTAGPVAGLQRLPARAQLSGCHEGPTNATSFPRVQQGAEVEAAPELAAAQGQGARGLWLSEERQAGGPADSAPRFGTNALPVSVGAQRVRPGACMGQGGRIPRGHSSTQTSRDPGPRRGFIRHHFVSIQSRKKVTSLWGGAGNSGLQRLGAQPPSRWGDPGCQQQGQVAPRMAQCVAQGQDLPPRRCHELSVGGAAQGPEAKMVQRRKAEPRSLLPSHASSASSASTTFTASRAEPRAEQTPWPPSKGRRGRVSEGPRSTTDGMGGLPHTREEDSLTPRRRTPSHPGGLPHTREEKSSEQPL